MMAVRLPFLLMALAVLPLAAAAQTAPCAPLTNDAERLACDAGRAAVIVSRGEQLFGPAPEDWLRIVDTVSPSGASYIYSVSEDGPYLLLEARSVPRRDAGGNAPACQLRITLPLDVATRVKETAAAIKAAPPALYGPREAVTVNPDGSRSIRLVLDSHDIITRLGTSEGALTFSRLAVTEDDITLLNNLVIGVANFSGDWTCGTD